MKAARDAVNNAAFRAVLWYVVLELSPAPYGRGDVASSTDARDTLQSAKGRQLPSKGALWQRLRPLPQMRLRHKERETPRCGAGDLIRPFGAPSPEGKVLEVIP